MTSWIMGELLRQSKFVCGAVWGQVYVERVSGFSGRGRPRSAVLDPFAKEATGRCKLQRLFLRLVYNRWLKKLTRSEWPGGHVR